MRNIVVGVDGSEASLTALEWALGEARLHGALLETVHVYPHPMPTVTPFALEMVTISAREAEALIESRRGWLAELIRDRFPDLDSEKIRITVLSGHAADQLVHRSTEADLLVVGARGHGGFRGLLVGSVAQQCIHHAKCPIVVVPRPRRDDAATGSVGS